jgi:hypothetical protein
MGDLNRGVSPVDTVERRIIHFWVAERGLPTAGSESGCRVREKIHLIREKLHKVC